MMDSLSTPYQEFGRSMLNLYSGRHRLWKLETDYMRKTLNDTAKVLVTPVTLTLYDTTSDDETNTRVLADSGYTSAERDSFYLWGNVLVRRKDGLQIRSESLWWNQQTHRVGSDKFVEIKTAKGDVMRGKGLDATESFSSWTLRENVSGVFPNFRQRAEGDGGP